MSKQTSSLIRNITSFDLKYQSYFSSQYLLGYDVSRKLEFFYGSFPDFFMEWDDSNKPSTMYFLAQKQIGTSKLCNITQSFDALRDRLYSVIQTVTHQSGVTVFKA